MGHLIPDAGVEIGSLVREEEGRHTTTASRLFDLPRGGHLIDSPGVRDFAPRLVDRLDLRELLGFVEVEKLAPRSVGSAIAGICGSLTTALCATPVRTGE